MMEKSARIYVAGHRGLVGSALVRQLGKQGFSNLIMFAHKDLDLLDGGAVATMFHKKKPEYVFLAAAKVGGIHANSTYPAQFIFENLQIQNNVIHQSYLNKAKKLVFLGSSCIYPGLCPQPIKEEYLLTGPLEPSNEPYAVAKIAGIKMCQSYNRQYGTNFISIMPTNLYGVNDNFHSENSHVVPALMRRFYEAKKAKATSVTVWGSGKPKRELLFSDDLADACIFLMNNYDGSEIINVGSGEEFTIAELAQLIKEVIGFEFELVFDSSKLDGTPRKILDVTRIQNLGWQPKTSLRDGLRMVYDWFLKEVVCG